MKIENYQGFNEIVKSIGGLFDVSNPSMEANIGKSVSFIKPKGTIHFRNDLIIEGIQKNYKGDTIYRLTYEGDNFGFPASPEDILINN